jgi:hypothetical protein
MLGVVFPPLLVVEVEVGSVVVVVHWNLYRRQLWLTPLQVDFLYERLVEQLVLYPLVEPAVQLQALILVAALLVVHYLQCRFRWELLLYAVEL